MATFTFSGQQEAILRRLVKRHIRQSIEGGESKQYVMACAGTLEELAKDAPTAATLSVLKLAEDYKPPGS